MPQYLKLIIHTVITLSLYDCQTESEITSSSCTQKTDCKGDRECMQGICINPEPDPLKNPNYSYVWNVGNCKEASTTVEELAYQKKNRENKLKFTRIISKENVNDRFLPCLDSYKCALNQNPDLYLISSYGYVDLEQKLFLMSPNKFPGEETCKNIEWNKTWYINCFLKNLNCLNL